MWSKWSLVMFMVMVVVSVGLTVVVVVFLVSMVVVLFVVSVVVVLPLEASHPVTFALMKFAPS